MTVLNRYRIVYQNDWDMPVSILNSQELIEGFLTRGESNELILPGFPLSRQTGRGKYSVLFWTRQSEFRSFT